MAKNCIDILKDEHPKVHDYLRRKAGIDFNPESEKVKDKWEQAAKELQHDTLDALHNAYNKIGVSGYETPTTQRPVAPIKPAVVTPAQNKKPVVVPLKKSETKVANPLEDKLDYLSHTAEDFDEFQRMVSADPELIDYINDQLAQTIKLQDISAIGPLEGEKVSERGSIGFNKQQVLMLFGSQMYDKPIAQVAVKELLQNSFDAVKARQNLTDNKSPGTITIGINRQERTISIKDDGIGMTPDIVKNAFLSIGGTNKEGLSTGERSGGLGLAKVQFLMGSQSVKVVTVRDGIKTSIEATNIQLYNDDFDINTEPTDEPNGSFVEVKIPEKYTTLEGQDKPIRFPGEYNGWKEFDILRKPLIGDVNVNVSDSRLWGTTAKNEVVPIGNNLTKELLPTFFSKAKFDWGEADIYISEDKVEGRYPNHQILSSGIYQFDHHFETHDHDPIPYNIVINIKPSVSSTSEQYPFNNTRERFKNTVSEDIEALGAFIRKHASGEAEKEAVDVFSDIKPLPQVDPSKILSPEERAKIFANLDELIEENKRRRIKNNEAPVEEAARDIYIRGGEVRDSRNDELITSKEIDEKKFDASFKADREIEDVAPVNTEFFNPAFPQYHNNTNIDYLKTPGAVEFITDFGNTVLQMVRFAGDELGYGYEKLRTDSNNKFFAGVSIDKTYGGVHIRKIINAIFVNPLAARSSLGVEGLVGWSLGVTIHEINHTTRSGETESFTSELEEVRAKIYDTGKYGLYEGLFRSVFKKHYDTFQTLKHQYDKSSTKNLSKAFEGDEIKGTNPGDVSGNEANVPAGQNAGEGNQGDRKDTGADKSGDVIASNLTDAGKTVNANTTEGIKQKLKQVWQKTRGNKTPPPSGGGTQTTGGTGANFNFWKNRVLPASGVFLEYLSKETMEEGTGQPITQAMLYDKKILDELEITGQSWIAKAKDQFKSTPTEYAERLFDDVKKTNARPSVRGLGMVSLINSIDNDLEFDDTLTYGQREKLAFVRRGLELEIAKNAREGSLTINVQRLIYKLYNGEYKFTESIEPIVTPAVGKMADDVIDKMRDPDSEISDVVREQHRNKDVSEAAPEKETPAKAAKATSFFVKLQKGMSAENVDKLKNKITEIANKINCGKKK